ncbi:Na+/H+ antiporter NhaA [Zwartia panacis]|uniref:Na+/H+ antiporter NhaA n=1 Tax=Zwartia panacis TaxID=2683345 RepID=UPI0025B49E32|nr:Na+/H+ antiporter NhaA [Zwartia panacis]MDN4016533.1 Na+/H+ antiporter NhaA [Zwartia panacis]
MTFSKIFKGVFESDKSAGILLMLSTLIALTIANSALHPAYLEFWNTKILGLSVEHWVNDGLMAIFFFLIGLELEREVYSGKLSNFRDALLPMVAAFGGVAIPAIIHFTLNRGAQTQAGLGIPMATDIAFALGVLAILGSRIPASLKLFLTTLAVIDDLIAIIVIAVFYTSNLSLLYLAGSLIVFGILICLNRIWRIMNLTLYLVGGVIMWFLMLKSGVHATVAGLLLAFAIPYTSRSKDIPSPSQRLEHLLHKPVVFCILPIFALANTGVIIGTDAMQDLMTDNSLGIIAGLVLGKPIGVTMFCLFAVLLGLTKLPSDLQWKHIFGSGLLAGIGFTMSIFITNLAFSDQAEMINSSKFAILVASLCSGVLGYIWLMFAGRPVLHTDANS